MLGTQRSHLQKRRGGCLFRRWKMLFKRDGRSHRPTQAADKMSVSDRFELWQLYAAFLDAHWAAGRKCAPGRAIADPGCDPIDATQAARLNVVRDRSDKRSGVGMTRPGEESGRRPFL